MSEKMKRLHQKAQELIEDEKWDEAIAVLTETIRLTKNPEEQALLYKDRGASYYNKDDLDHAIEDYGKAIELGQDDAEVYVNRGMAYTKKGNLDLAIKDYDKAIEMGFEEAIVYRNRGLAYAKEKDYNRAIEDYDKAIILDSRNASTYHYRGDAYFMKMELNRAIEDYDKAIDLNPKKASAYNNRGLAYSRKSEFDRAIGDFNKAADLHPDLGEPHLNSGFAYIGKDEYFAAYNAFVVAGNNDEKLRLTVPFAYIAFRINDSSLSNDKQADFFEHYLRLFGSVFEIKEPQLLRCQEVAHYTSLHVVKSLANNKPFRLYNAMYMNDPEEGQTFFEIMKREIGIDVQKMFYGNDSENPHSSPAYIGSFVKIDSQKDERKDKLFLWRTYGKHDNDEAAGACLIFKEEQFTESASPLQIGSMSQLMNITEQRETTSQNSPPILYEVIYKNKISTKLSKKLKTLAENLEKIDECCKLHKTDKEKFADLTREVLDSIRFLFKEDHYREENEARIIEMLYSVAGEKVPQRKVDMARIPPRFYQEVPGGIKFSEVILGPKTDNVPEWEQWLREKNIENVSQSDIKYKGNS